MSKKFRQKVSSYLTKAKSKVTSYFSEMNSSKVTAISTTVIAVSLLGFIFNSTYNSPKNIEKRCISKYKKAVKKGPNLSGIAPIQVAPYKEWFNARQKYLLSECLK